MTREKVLKVAKPILFNTDMVEAILQGRKSVTRRVAFPNKDLREFNSTTYPNGWSFRGRVYPNWNSAEHGIKRIECPPKYKVGDILYVRETWTKGSLNYEKERYYYKADKEIPHCRWEPSIHMPKEAARIFLRGGKDIPSGNEYSCRTVTRYYRRTSDKRGGFFSTLVFFQRTIAEG